MIANPLINSSLFVTPENFNELQDLIERTYFGPEKAVAYQVMMFTNNLCHKLFEDALVETKFVRSET